MSTQENHVVEWKQLLLRILQTVTILVVSEKIPNYVKYRCGHSEKITSTY